MLTGYDTVTPSEFRRLIAAPGNELVALLGYDDGAFNDFAQIVSEYPKCRHASYTVTAAVDGDILDIERGDASPADFPGWCHRHHNIRLDRPAGYCSASQIDAVVNAAAAAGLRRSEYLIVSAHYTRQPHICGPKTCGFPQANATQWNDVGPHGENVDRLLFDDGFWPELVTSDIARFAGSVDLESGKWSVHGTPGTFKPGVLAGTWQAMLQFDRHSGHWTIISEPAIDHLAPDLPAPEIAPAQLAALNEQHDPTITSQTAPAPVDGQVQA